MKKLLTAFVLSAALLPVASRAVELMPDYATLTTGWVTDRYEPASFSNVGAFQGRNDVLGITIDSTGDLANRGAGYQFSFYNTQGRQFAVAGGAGSVLSADLWIPTSWRDAANGYVRTDMWGVMTDGTAVSGYPIIGFSNYGGAARFRVWDDTAWVDLGTSVGFDAWNSLSIEFTGSAYVYSINGSVILTDNTVSGSTGFSATIMQAYNFADPSLPNPTPTTVEYTAHWANASVPDGGSTLALLGLGIAGLAGMSFRKRN